jgi:hypothetical protein
MFYSIEFTLEAESVALLNIVISIVRPSFKEEYAYEVVMLCVPAQKTSIAASKHPNLISKVGDHPHLFLASPNCNINMADVMSCTLRKEIFAYCR